MNYLCLQTPCSSKPETRTDKRHGRHAFQSRAPCGAQVRRLELGSSHYHKRTILKNYLLTYLLPLPLNVAATLLSLLSSHFYIILLLNIHSNFRPLFTNTDLPFQSAEQKRIKITRYILAVPRTPNQPNLCRGGIVLIRSLITICHCLYTISEYQLYCWPLTLPYFLTILQYSIIYTIYTRSLYLCFEAPYSSSRPEKTTRSREIFSLHQNTE